jgi:hypothetical protein
MVLHKYITNICSTNKQIINTILIHKIEPIRINSNQQNEESERITNSNRRKQKKVKKISSIHTLPHTALAIIAKLQTPPFIQLQIIPFSQFTKNRTMAMK